MSILTPFTCVVLFTAGASAPLNFEIKHVSGVPAARLLATQRHFAAAGRLAWRAPATKEESAIVQAVRRIYAVRFRPEIVADTRITTVTENGADVLVARWTVRDAGLTGDVIVRNTPNDTTFVFQLPRHSWTSDEAVRLVFARLLLPPNAAGVAPPGKGVRLSLANDVRTGLRFGAGGLMESYIPRQMPRPQFQSWIDCWETPAASYLAVGFDESVTPEIPLELRVIPERFPPLNARMKAWSKQRLLSELGHRDEFRQWDRLLTTRSGHAAEPAAVREQLSFSPTLWSSRDMVLAAELIQRDVTDGELLSLWQARRRHENGQILRAIVTADQTPRFAAPIRAYLRQGGFSEGKGTNPFCIVNTTEAADFTDAALAVLRAAPEADSAFRYAAAHGQTPAVYRELAQTPRAGIGHDAGRDFELQRMRARLKLNADGHPLAVR